MNLSKAQRFALERFAAGDSVGYRCNFMFCFTERSKWVLVFRSDHTPVQQRTLSALFDAGYLGVGYVITDAGRTALKR